MTPDSGGGSWSAGALSLGFHVLLMVLLAVAVRPVPRQVSAEPDRGAAIVLVRPEADRQVTYFDEDSEQAGQTRASDNASGGEDLGERSEELPEEALPPGQALAALQLPGVALPEETGAVGGGGEELVPTPQLRVSGRPRILPGLGDEQILAEEAARQQQASEPAGPTARVSVFGSSEAQGRSFVFVLDRSASMGAGGLGVLAAAERELVAALSPLEPSHRFEIIAYHHKPVYLGPRRLVAASQENKQRVLPFLEGLAPLGGTEHFTALLAALRLEPDVIFLLTDGDHPYLNKAQLGRILREAQPRTAIHCIQFGWGPRQEENFMQLLAEQTGGSYGYVNRAPH